ncbi:MAG: sulfite exporter TauE/SafE family protein [Pseudomonadota bacterium]|nr:sulfite exporter TauE/SafE family protein [Pseudomonadota bacterium]
MQTYFIYLSVGSIIGITSSLFGFGGGFLVVPALYWLLPKVNVPSNLVMHAAVATSLAIMILNSINSTLAHERLGNISWAVFLKISPYIAGGAMLGAFLSQWISGETLRYFFICFLLLVIIRNMLNNEFTEISNKPLKFPSKISIGIIGTGIGIFATLLGVGGSVLTIPFLRRCNMRMLNAVALAAPLSIPVALFGAATYFLIGLRVNGLPYGFAGFIYIPAFLGIGLGGFIGVPLGARIGRQLPDKSYARVYIILLSIIVIIMLRHEY